MLNLNFVHVSMAFSYFCVINTVSLLLLFLCFYCALSSCHFYVNSMINKVLFACS
ncbi:hypothetical protein EDWATA_00932 [Edwardsiella tarda ATCC 23685]|uniref:Uncharacterized protein n=1 Tax=Edwardsiella tarda ATCC 23685 TaxID=500638 RepID=D4F2I2_EDWTA|nr:hypothetical protein EDWATA_00932 [Edwardsiella tarda ATCC 23685]